MANSSTLITTVPAVTDEYILCTSAASDFGIDCSAAFEGVFHFIIAESFKASNNGPIYQVDISHDGTSGRIDVFDDTTGLTAPTGSNRIWLIEALFCNSVACGLTFYDGTTALPTLDLAANQGRFGKIQKSGRV